VFGDMSKSYRIIVRTLQGIILTYSVENYEIDEGFLTFFDKKSQMVKRFSVTNCEIQEVF